MDSTTLPSVVFLLCEMGDIDHSSNLFLVEWPERDHTSSLHCDFPLDAPLLSSSSDPPSIEALHGGETGGGNCLFNWLFKCDFPCSVCVPGEIVEVKAKLRELLSARG